MHREGVRRSLAMITVNPGAAILIERLNLALEFRHAKLFNAKDP